MNVGSSLEVRGARELPEREVFDRRRGRYGRHNVVVLACQTLAWAATLLALDRALALGTALGAALAAGLLAFFAMLMQGVFSLMHEYFHRNAHASRRANYVIGVVASTLFGTSATLHRVHHWGHHLRNRTEAERGEFVHPSESRAGKTALYYFAICGGLWLGGLVFPLLSLFIPYRFVRALARTKRFNTYAAAHEQFKPRDWTAMRVEALGLYLFWGAILASGVVAPATLLVAYGVFAFSWSSLQWAYHLRTPLHIIEGAYNLRAPRPVRALWLNFNYNLTHHRRPDLPWQELPDATELRETQPLWYRWALMAKPPVPFSEDAVARFEKTYF